MHPACRTCSKHDPLSPYYPGVFHPHRMITASETPPPEVEFDSMIASSNIALEATRLSPLLGFEPALMILEGDNNSPGGGAGGGPPSGAAKWMSCSRRTREEFYAFQAYVLGFMGDASLAVDESVSGGLTGGDIGPVDVLNEAGHAAPAGDEEGAAGEEGEARLQHPPDLHYADQGDAGDVPSLKRTDASPSAVPEKNRSLNGGGGEDDSQNSPDVAEALRGPPAVPLFFTESAGSSGTVGSVVSLSSSDSDSESEIGAAAAKINSYKRRRGRRPGKRFSLFVKNHLEIKVLDDEHDRFLFVGDNDGEEEEEEEGDHEFDDVLEEEEEELEEDVLEEEEEEIEAEEELDEEASFKHHDVDSEGPSNISAEKEVTRSFVDDPSDSTIPAQSKKDTRTRDDDEAKKLPSGGAYLDGKSKKSPQNPSATDTLRQMILREVVVKPLTQDQRIHAGSAIAQIYSRNYAVTK